MPPAALLTDRDTLSDTLLTFDLMKRSVRGTAGWAPNLPGAHCLVSVAVSM